MRLVIAITLLIWGDHVISGAEWTPYIEDEASNSTGNWGFVHVRQEAHLFWWLKYTTHEDGYLNRPWIIWLQGGPGRPGTGYGNYLMFGPEDEQGNQRPYTWVNSVNVMFIDSPVGVGFSYLEEGAPVVENSTQVADDLVALMQAFLPAHSEFQEMPLYVFGQSYGGKMVVAFAHQLEQARRQGKVSCRLEGVAIGNGFVSPWHFTKAWPSFLLHMSIIGQTEYKSVMSTVEDLHTRYLSGEPHENVSMDWYNLMLGSEMQRASMYNILLPGAAHNIYRVDLTEFMNGPIRDQLRIIPDNLTWIGRAQDIYSGMINTEFLYSVVHMVDNLLARSNVSIIVYSGQLDVICCTKGAVDWVDSLQWEGMSEYRRAERIALQKPNDPDTTEMYVQSAGQLKFYWILNAGHVVPLDVPETGLRLLNRIVFDVDK